MWFGLGARHHSQVQKLLAVWTQPRDKRGLYSVIQDVKVSWETRLNCWLSYFPHRHFKRTTEDGRWEAPCGFSARPSNTSSFRNWVIALRGKIFGKIDSSPGNVTFDLDIICFLLNPLWESSKRASRTSFPLRPLPGKYQSWILFLVVNERTSWPERLKEQIRSELWRKSGSGGLIWKLWIIKQYCNSLNINAIFLPSIMFPYWFNTTQYQKMLHKKMVT